MRDKLVQYIKKVASTAPRREGRVSIEDLARGLRGESGESEESKQYSIGRVNRSGKYEGLFHKIGVVDGGSNILALNAGYIGIVVSVGIIIEDNHIVGRVISEPEIIPSDPSELPNYESLDNIIGVVDKTREALVFETAYKMLDHDLDLLIIDGPVAPYGALAKIVTKTKSEELAWRRYNSAVIKLHFNVSGKNTSLVGFVKRPRSKYLATLNDFNNFDHVLLANMLKPGEYFPEPPFKLSVHPELFHEAKIQFLVKLMNLRITYLRMTDSTPPYRIDFSVNTEKNYREILSYLYSIRTREGIPYIIMKADEETKVTRKLLKELYEDALHSCIVDYIHQDPSKIIPLLPEYGGV
jgi:hypothetical protein